MVALPKTFQTTNFGIANASHCHPQKFALPKAFQTIRDANRLAFLLFVCLRKRAFDTASKQKSLSLS
jgi:hypothetical protein